MDTEPAATEEEVVAPATEEPITETTPTEEPESFGWGDTEDTDTGEAEQSPEDEQSQEPAYEVDFGELPVPEDLKTTLCTIGQEFGVPSDQFAGLVGKLDGLLVEQQTKQLNQEGAKLKEEWGAEYSSNLKIVGNTLRAYAAELGVEPQELQRQLPPTSANMKLLLKLNSLQSGHSSLTGSPPAKNDQSWFGDSKNELFKAWCDPSHPRHSEALSKRNAAY